MHLTEVFFDTVMSLRRIAFHYDVLSPYSWLGFEQIHRHYRVWNDESIRLELKPSFIFGIMNAADNPSPVFVRNKQTYMAHDLDRLSRFLHGTKRF